MADRIGVDVTKSTGARARMAARVAERNIRVLQMLSAGTAYDDIVTATGIDRTTISKLARQAGLLQRDVRVSSVLWKAATASRMPPDIA